ncbi:MAG TPA: hypothetical protein VFA10_13165 [Ktedonobacteraceae bacterium]|nr:hypothetical protein [Ktedonobacteraceae bacterium]
MEAIILDEPGQLRLLEMEEPSEPGPGQALVRRGLIGTAVLSKRWWRSSPFTLR